MGAHCEIISGEVLSRLPWDSNYLGYPVARIEPPELDDETVGEALRSARAQSVRLVYWATTPDRLLSPELLDEFGGIKVDQKTIFARDLEEDGTMVRVSRATSFEVIEYPRAPACARLLELSLSAGQYSRFKTDPNITAEQFCGLYEIWMQRSTMQELASNVFVAARRETPAEILGVITVSKSAAAVGSIGILAVLDSVRGQGVGTRLIQAAHVWMLSVGLRRAEVVTQLENQSACGLYRSCGYQLREVMDYYHFWPTAVVQRRAIANRADG